LGVWAIIVFLDFYPINGGLGERGDFFFGETPRKLVATVEVESLSVVF
jgi:hypothetical protein